MVIHPDMVEGAFNTGAPNIINYFLSKQKAEADFEWEAYVDGLDAVNGFKPKWPSGPLSQYFGWPSTYKENRLQNKANRLWQEYLDAD